MAISLSDLTGASTSGNVLNEVNSYADFLDSCPRLVNKADPSGATDAVQTVATKQPVALPLIDGDGYLFCPGISGNYAQTPDDDSLDFAGDAVIEVDVTMKSWTPSANSSFCGKYLSSGDQRSFRFLLRTDKKIQVYFSEDGTAAGLTGAAVSAVVPFSDNQRGQVRFSFNSSNGIVQFFTSTDKGVTWTQLGSDISTGKTAIHSGTADLYIGSYYSNSELVGNAAIHSVKLYDSITPSSSSLRFNCDFTSPRIPHGATEFTCETGQVVTVNTSGNNPAKVIKKAVLRYDGVDDFMDGVFGQTLSSGYLFAAFSLLGDGGGNWVRLLSTNPTGGTDSSNSMFIRRYSGEDAFRVRYDAAGSTIHDGMYDSARGDMLLDVRIINGAQTSFINNADEENKALSGTVAVDEFVLAARKQGDFNTPIDLEYLAFFPATLTDSQADQVRNFINNRNKVFYRWDTDGYYFFDPQKATFTGDFTSVNTLDGYITGSDLGDTDARSNLTLEQAGIQEAQPYADGYKITFNDNAEYLNFTNGASQSLAGWQIVGTSLGTFAYKVNANTQTELNLLGNLGTTAYRKSGDLYGIILLPESATSREIEEARKLLIDRGAADGAIADSYIAAWYTRQDMVEFKPVDMSRATNLQSAWNFTKLTTFPALDLSGSLTCFYGWKDCSDLATMGAINAENCSRFDSAWQNCSSLTQFPSGAKLGTEASNVNFTSAWQSSGLTSFSTPLPTATILYQTWNACGSLASFSSDIPLATNADITWYNCPSLTSFSAELPSVTSARYAWKSCTSLVSFSTELPLLIDANQAWYNCQSLTSFSTPLPSVANVNQAWQNDTSLTDFSADVFASWNPTSINNGAFNETWDGCTSLTAQSVENILVPIAASGKWATTSGLEGGTALTDATIDIDYNVATGSLTAATLSAIETLNGRGWSVNINGVIQ